MTRARTIAEIPTPALLVDVPAMARNIRRMAEFFAEGPCKLRPHFKAHKTPEIARRQLAATPTGARPGGSCTGLTCATVAEAEVAAEFCDDILIANPGRWIRRTARDAPDTPYTPGDPTDWDPLVDDVAPYAGRRRGIDPGLERHPGAEL